MVERNKMTRQQNIAKLNKLQKGEEAFIVEAVEDFYGSSWADKPIVTKKWIWNWKFPFLHRVVHRYSLSEWQRLINNTLNSYLTATFSENVKTTKTSK
jgi:hypothetical protein